MNQEQQLEQVVQSIKDFEVPKAPPVFELFAALVAISISILLFLLDGIFVSGDHLFYRLMLAVMDQPLWALSFLSAGLLSALGMLLDAKTSRIIALLFMTGLFGTVAAFYIITFPNLSGILMFWTTIFTAASVPMVKYTGIRVCKK